MRSSAVLAAVRHYTPSSIANAIVGALPCDDKRTWLEPCVGGGVFLEALSSRGVGRERVTALDLDPRPKAMHRLAQLHSGQDFISWAAETSLRFDNVVGNPPYITLER